MDKWFDAIKEPPKEEGSYLVFIVDSCGETRMEVMELFEWANCFDWAEHMYSCWKDHNTITHWRPLPEQPNVAIEDYLKDENNE